MFTEINFERERGREKDKNKRERERERKRPVYRKPDARALRLNGVSAVELYDRAKHASISESAIILTETYEDACIYIHTYIHERERCKILIHYIHK